MNYPNFFIIGAPKCGTTALASYLAEHPSVFMAPKEVHYYNSDHQSRKHKDIDAYLHLFEKAGTEHSAIGEASVWYLYSQVAVPNILADNSRAKLIVMLRNPIEMAYSLHEQTVFSGYETEVDFEKAWHLQEERRHGRKIPISCPEPLLLQYRNACATGSQLQRVAMEVPRDQLLTVVFDDFRDNPRITWLSILDFLGVPDDGRTHFPVVNPAKERRSLALKRVFDAYARLGKLIGFRGMGTGILVRINQKNIVVRKRKPLSPSFRATLRRELLPEIELLEAQLNRDFSTWKA